MEIWFYSVLRNGLLIPISGPIADSWELGSWFFLPQRPEDRKEHKVSQSVWIDLKIVINYRSTLFSEGQIAKHILVNQ